MSESCSDHTLVPPEGLLTEGVVYLVGRGDSGQFMRPLTPEDGSVDLGDNLIAAKVCPKCGAMMTLAGGVIHT